VTHRLAAIGLRHGHAHDLIKGLTKLGSVELIALAEDDEASRRQAETRYEVTGYQDYRELLRQETVDIVTVAAMNNEKADVIPECIRQGKHVLADKPLVISLEDLAEIRNALDGTDSVLSMNLALRFSPAYLRAREIVDEGRIGKPVAFVGMASHKLLPETRKIWELDSRLNGGILVDVGVHQIDLARWMIGSEIEEISAYRSNRKFTQIENFFDNAEIVSRFRCGAVAMLTADWLRDESWEAHSESRFWIIGTEARLEADRTRKTIILSSPGNYREEVQVPDYGGTVSTDFIEGIEGRPRSITNDEVLRSMAAALEAERAAQLGKMARVE